MSAKLTPDVPSSLSPLDQPFPFTTFNGLSGFTKIERTHTLRQFARVLETQKAKSKKGLPLINFGLFGDTLSGKNSLRYDDNLLSISGIICEQDSGEHTIDRVVEILTTARIACVVVTSPSHTPGLHKWRVYFPTSRLLPREARDPLAARINGLFDGELAPESFAKSQAFYYGYVEGAPDHQVHLIDGRYIDECGELDAGAIKKPKIFKLQDNVIPVPKSEPLPEGEWGTKFALTKLAYCCDEIRAVIEGSCRNTVNAAGFYVARLVTSGDLDKGVAFSELGKAIDHVEAYSSYRSRIPLKTTLALAFADGSVSAQDLFQATEPPRVYEKPDLDGYNSDEANGTDERPSAEQSEPSPETQSAPEPEKATTTSQETPQNSDALKRLIAANPFKPVITMSEGQLAAVVDQVCDVIKRPTSDLFLRAGSQIVKPGFRNVPGHQGHLTVTGVLDPVTPSAIRFEISQATILRKFDARTNHFEPRDPKIDFAHVVEARAPAHGFRPIVGVSSTPTIRPDGSILSAVGYDQQTGLFFKPERSAKINVPDQPTREDALKALDILAELVAETSFVGETDKSVAIAAMLTALAQGCVPVKPLFCFHAHSAGTGKTYVCEIVSVLTSGRRIPVAAASSSREETEKALAGALMAGYPMICLDNFKAR
jgi:hypothetical protein